MGVHPADEVKTPTIPTSCAALFVLYAQVEQPLSQASIEDQRLPSIQYLEDTADNMPIYPFNLLRARASSAASSWLLIELVMLAVSAGTSLLLLEPCQVQ